jgi:adenosine deaminase
MILSVFSVRT